MKKQYREQIVIDEFTRQLVNALAKKMAADGKKVSKGEIYRQSVHQLAQSTLSEDEFNKILKNAMYN